MRNPLLSRTLRTETRTRDSNSVDSAPGRDRARSGSRRSETSPDAHLDEIAALFAVAFRRALLRKNLANGLAASTGSEPSSNHAVNGREKDEDA